MTTPTPWQQNECTKCIKCIKCIKFTGYIGIMKKIAHTHTQTHRGEMLLMRRH